MLVLVAAACSGESFPYSYNCSASGLYEVVGQGPDLLDQLLGRVLSVELLFTGDEYLGHPGLDD